MPTWLPTAIIAALCTVSAAVWNRRLRAGAALPATPTAAGEDAACPASAPAAAAVGSPAAPAVPPGAMLFAVLWIAYDLAGDVLSAIAPAAPAEVDPNRQLLQMQQNCWLLGAATCVAWMLLSRGEHEQLRAFGLRRRGLAAQVRSGLTTVTAAWLPVFGVLLLTLPLRTAERQHSVFQLLGVWPSLEMYAWAALAAVVIAPLFEELVFRVILQTWLESRLEAWAVPAAALLFATVHRFPDSLAIVPLALVLGSAYQRRRSYVEVVTAHGVFNLVMLVLYATMPTG